MAGSLSDFPLHAGSKIDRRVVIIGIGNLLNGDDGAGVLAAQMLRESLVRHGRLVEPLPEPPAPAVWVIDAGPAPESFTGPVRRFQPDLVILIDAAELGEAPGAIRWFDWQAAQGLSGSTHTLPPSMLARYLITETGCQVILIGIQPRQLEMDSGLSTEAQAAVTQLVQFLSQIFM